MDIFQYNNEIKVDPKSENPNEITEENNWAAILCAPDETEMLTKIEAITLHRSQAIILICLVGDRTFCTHNTKT